MSGDNSKAASPAAAPTGAPRARRQLNAALDDQANIAAAHLEAMNSRHVERMEVDYPLGNLRPSPGNPRRKSLDKAGVTAELVQQLAIRPRESFENWSARLEEFLSTEAEKLDTRSRVVWDELFDLAISLYTGELIQPIVASPEGEILAGERRWTASLLAGKNYNRVILRTVPKNRETLYRLIENIRRSELSVAETAWAIRQVMVDVTEQPCGDTNREITISLVQSVIGAGETQSAYYRAICRLPEDDPVLAAILAGGYTSLRVAYEDASRRLRELRQAPPAAEVVVNQGELTSNTGRASTPKAPAARVPSFKARLPGTEGGIRFLKAVSTIEDLPSEAAEALKNTLASWNAAPDKARQNMLASLLTTLFEAFDPLDEAASVEGDGADGGKTT